MEQTIREMMRNRQENGLIKDVIVPTERVIEPGKNGQKRTTTRKFYPGYIMINMIMTDFSWHMVQSIPKGHGILSGGKKPSGSHGARGG